LPVALATPSLHTIYQSPPNLSRSLVIGISQSGQAEDVRLVLEDARKQGALTIGVTNYDDSPTAQTAEYHLSLMAGEEMSVAATKTYTAQLTVIAMLLTALVDNNDLRDTLAKLPEYVEETLKLSESVKDWAERYRYMEQFVVIGRGYNYSTAFEIQLKVQELCGIMGDGYSEADFRHGPIALIKRGFPVIAVAPEGKTMPYVVDLLEKLHEQQSELLVISNHDNAFAHAQNRMEIPTGIPEWLTPMLSVIPGQVFAMQQAIVRGFPVDKPRGLNKVTVTR
jgi:glucosamine--fructose-6-phosphate aminotransferase (isomerizing)